MLILRRLSFWARFRLCALAFLLLPVAMSATAQELLPTPQDLAQAAIGGRADRTPAEGKLDSTLMFALRALAGAQSKIPLLQQPGIQSFISQNVAADQTIFVVIKAKVSPDLVQALHSAVAYDVSEFPQYDTITARVPVDAILGLALRTDVLSIGPRELSVTNRYFPTPEEIQAWSGGITNVGSVTWQGVTAHKANISQSAGITGSGVKVCVLSDGVDSLAARQASGDLGVVTVLAGQSGHVVGETHDEGTAMLEIVHDMAPSAALYFATAGPSAAQFATNILNLRAAGCDIIVDDVTYFNEGAFQDAIIAQAVNTVTAAGALYFSSAANSGNLTHGTSGTYEGDFVASAAAVPAVIAAVDGSSVKLHSFGANPYTTLTAQTSYVSLKWSDPLAGSVNDYDLFVTNSTGTTILGQSTIWQQGSQDPYELAVACSNGSCTFPVNSRIYIVKYSGVARALRLDTNRGRISNGTTGSTFGHNAAASALTVAAVNVATAGGGAFVGGATNPVETYSSDGPRKMFYNPNGTAIISGNVLFATNGGTTLAKVDLAASDCGSTTTPGFTPFCGTSAAAPTAAAIAALIKSTNPSLTKAQITTALLNSALNIEVLGIDRDSGVGIVMAPAAPVTLPAAPTIGTAIPGNTSISVAFTPGAIGSGSLIGYSAACTNDHITYYFSAGGSNSSPINVTGLVNGSAYTCIVATQSTVGWGPWSAFSNTVIPGTPGAPTNITVTPYPGRLQVSFTAPANNGSAITGYTVTCTAAGQTTRTGTGASSPISVYGLTPGVAYSCTVKASNTNGTGAPSTPVVTTTSLRINLAPILMLLLND